MTLAISQSMLKNIYRDRWSANLPAKYTGKRYPTLVNDEFTKSYTLVNFDAGYRLPTSTVFHDPSIRFNVYNLFDTEYINLSGLSSYTPQTQGTIHLTILAHPKLSA